MRFLSTSIKIAAFCLCSAAFAQVGLLYNYTISTTAGDSQFGNNIPATQGLLYFPYSVAVDSQGAVYIADTDDNIVRKVAGGQISTIAGNGVAGFSGDGAAAAQAQLDAPVGVAVDKTGNVYIYDALNSVVRKVDTNGIISTFAGTPKQQGLSGDGGAATAAQLNLSFGGTVATDATGNVYISDFGNGVVRKVTVSTGVISTIAGTIGKHGNSGDGGLATSAILSYPEGLALDSADNLYITDTYNQSIRMVSAATGIISTLAGNNQIGSGGDGGPPKSASLQYPQDVAVDSQGNIYIADTSNNKIRKVTAGANATISTLAGTGGSGLVGDGGPANSAELSSPSGVAVDASGNVYIADRGNNRVRQVSSGIINEFAGADHAQGDGGKATAAYLFSPQHFAWDVNGNLYIADTGNNRIRKVTPDGTISTLTSAISGPAGIVIDTAGNIYVSGLYQVHKIDTQGNITTIVNAGGTGGYSGDGQAATSGQLSDALGLAIDASDNLYIADSFNHRIRKVSGGIITTVAGSGAVCGNPCNSGSFGGDGGPATSANLAFPADVAFDSSGNLLIADSGNSAIRMVDSEGIIHTIAGTGGKSGFGGDVGPATSALLNDPSGVSADAEGNLYVSDTGNQVVRIVDALGVISSVAGINTGGFSGDGGPATSAELHNPDGIGVDSSGNVWFADRLNSRIRKLTPTGPSVPGANAVVNAASFVPGGLVPGGMATLFGSNLTAQKGINLSSGLPLATALLNSSVKFNNTVAAPIFAVDNVNGQQQINFQVPWEVAPLIGSTVVMQVENNGTLGVPVRVPVIAAQPGVFNYTVGSNTFGVVLHANFQLADSAHPVTPGEVVLIYCTNLGAVSPTIADGAPGTGKELTVAKPTVTIGGATAAVSFSGLAPDFVGLDQINVQVPAGLSSGNQPLVVSIAGASSKTVLLPVK